eukprot:GHVQ01032626.1.p1 GENE.GHVQ01032626.1~~GHVQ01032626.1.p1  ORF type:complete len:675 (+),score=92.39 GHVQ01032626.1:209-2233(+)
MTRDLLHPPTPLLSASIRGTSSPLTRLQLSSNTSRDPSSSRCLGEPSQTPFRRSASPSPSQKSLASGGSTPMLSTETLQALYSTYHHPNYHHDHFTSASCAGGLACHSPGRCATCDNNVEPHFHTYVPSVPKYIHDLSIPSAGYLPSTNPPPSIPSSILSPMSSPRPTSDVDGLPVLDSGESPQPHTSAEASADACLPMNELPDEEESSTDSSTPTHSHSSLKSIFSTIASTFRDSSSTSQMNSTSAGAPQQAHSVGGSPSSEVTAGDSCRESTNRTAIELLSYRVRIAIDKSLFRINELQELTRRVIVIAVDHTSASKNAVQWCRQHYIKAESDIIVLLSAYEDSDKSTLAIAYLGHGYLASQQAVQPCDKECKGVKYAKKMIGAYYKQYLTGCDVYPLLLPVDKFTPQPTHYHDPDSSTEAGGGSPASVDDHSTCRRPQNLKSAIASVIFRAVAVLRAGHLVLGCRHSDNHPGTVSTTTTEVLTTKSSVLQNSSAASGTLLPTKSANLDLAPSSNLRVSVPIGEDSLPSHSHGPPLPGYTRYLSKGVSAAAALRRAFRGSVTHALLKKIPTTCTVILVRRVETHKNATTTVTSTTPISLASDIVSSRKDSGGVAVQTDASQQTVPETVDAMVSQLKNVSLHMTDNDAGYKMKPADGPVEDDTSITSSEAIGG